MGGAGLIIVVSAAPLFFLPLGEIEIPPPISPAREIISMRSQNGKVFSQDDKSVKAVFATAPVHFKDPNGDWQDLDFSVVDRGTHFETKATEISVSMPKTADGNFSDSLGTSSSRIKFLGASPVQPIIKRDGWGIYGQTVADRLIYKDIYPGVDLEVMAYPFGVSRELVYKTPAATVVPIQFESENIGNVKILTKLISDREENFKQPFVLSETPAGNIKTIKITPQFSASVVYPIRIDPTDFYPALTEDYSFEINANTNWNTMRTTTSSTCLDQANEYTVARLSGGNYDVYRNFFNWNTGTTLLNYSVSSTSVEVYVNAAITDNNETESYANLGRQTGGDTSCANTDVDNIVGFPGPPVTKQATDIDLGLLVNPATTTFYLTSTGNGNVATTSGAYTKFILMMGHDMTDTAPTGSNFFRIGLSDGNRPPLLSVTATAPAAAAAPAPNNKFLPGFMGWLIQKVYARNN